MTFDWSPLVAELEIWRRDGLHLPLWWRDDDAIDETPALHRLFALGDALALPVHLAVIPKPTTRALANLCLNHPTCVPVVHGWTHENHAPEGAKKAEFGHPRGPAKSDIKQALAHARSLFGPSLFEMFVPPWNRIDPSVVATLAPQGYRALSTYTPRPAKRVKGLVQINTHIDPIHWKAGGGLVPSKQIISGIVETLQGRRLGAADAAEPLGFLTHHLVHDEAIWDFTQQCLAVLLGGGAAPCNLRELKAELP